jgi:uncharacterized protein with HEPN domain
MLDAAREALSFIASRTRDELGANRMLALAVVKDLEIIGEAATKISDSTRGLAPEIPWPLIMGMRHRLIHAYYEIDFEIVWNTARSRLPEITVVLERLLAGRG